MASRPSVFLAAAIQRTSTIRLGPLVYVLPLYHPLRLYEEICMLDHLSRGRLTVGVGRGGALIEHQRFGIDPAVAPAMYHEAFAVLMRAFENEVLDFEGRFYNYKDYVIQVRPVQRPHPPIWYGAPNADAIAWARAASTWYRWGPARGPAQSAIATVTSGKNLGAMAGHCQALASLGTSSLLIATTRHER